MKGKSPDLLKFIKPKVLFLGMNHKDLADRISTIIHDVSQYAPGKIEQVIEEEIPTSDSIRKENFAQLMQSIQIDISQDKGYCQLIGVKNYTSLPEEDRHRIRVFAFYLAQMMYTGEKNQEVVLPLL